MVDGFDGGAELTAPPFAVVFRTDADRAQVLLRTHHVFHGDDCLLCEAAMGDDNDADHGKRIAPKVKTIPQPTRDGSPYRGINSRKSCFSNAATAARTFAADEAANGSRASSGGCKDSGTASGAGGRYLLYSGSLSTVFAA